MNKKLLSLAANFILGLMLLFFGLTVVVGGTAGNIVLAVFAMVLGIGYVFAGLLNFLKVADDGFNKLLKALEISLFPIYIIVETIVVMAFVGGNNLSPTDYILKISLLAAALATSVFAYVVTFAKNDQLKKALGISLVAFIGLHLLSFVFLTGGGFETIGNISLIDIIMFASYIVLSVDIFKVTLISAKGNAEKHFSEPEKEEQIEDQPQEEQIEDAEEVEISENNDIDDDASVEE